MSTLELGSAVVGLVIFHKQADTAQHEFTCQYIHYSAIEDVLSRTTAALVRCYEPGGVLDIGLFTPHRIRYG